MHRPSISTALATLAIAALPFVARPAAAQATALAQDSVVAAPAASINAPEAPAAEARPAGPRAEGTAVAARLPRDHRPTDARDVMAPQHPHAGQAVALMLVGATAVVLGLVVGGGAQAPLIVGGAVVGLIGLYQYLL